MFTVIKNLSLMNKAALMIALPTLLIIGLLTRLYVNEVQAAIVVIDAELAGIVPDLEDLDRLVALQTRRNSDPTVETTAAGLIDHMAATADSSGLSLDPESDSYHLINAADMIAPNLLNTLGHLANHGNASSLELALLSQRASDGHTAMTTEARKAFAVDEVMNTTLSPALAEADSAVQKALAALANDPAGKTIEPLFAAALRAEHAFVVASTHQVEATLNGRRVGFEHRYTRVLILLGIGLLALVTMAWWMFRAISAQSRKERLIADENLRIRNALESTVLPVRIADPDGKIIYVNQALREVLLRDEAAFRREHPGFSPQAVIGASIGLLYASSEDALARLRALDRTNSGNYRFGGRTYEVTTTPLYDVGGIKQGTVGQWVDRTDQLATEAEIGAIVHAASEGDFSQRVELAGKEGFFRQLAESMNQLMSTSSAGLGEVARALSALAEGDLTQRITSEYHGTFGQLKDDSNKTVEQLTQIVGQIKTSIETISEAAREIATGNADLSTRTEQQAASLEETASSMEELTSTVRQNAENASQANQLAIGASDIAVNGRVVVGEVVRTMDEIGHASRKIVDIISVIDGIAFQTNILALNAAVEAARAGEQGRGFAVVAAEVRNLAQRCAAAAKEIKNLIGDSVEKVDNGFKLVEQAGRTMDEVVTSVKKVTDIMSEIAAASKEQSSGIDQVNKAITHMDEVTQQNAALVEEAMAATHSLEEQTDSLVEAMSVFTLNGDRPASRQALGQALGQPLGLVAVPAEGSHSAEPSARPLASPAKPEPALRRAPRAVGSKRVAVAAGAGKRESHWSEF